MITTQSKPTYRKTILVDGQQVPAHLLWTDEGHHGRPDSRYCYRLIDGRYRDDSQSDGTIVTAARPSFSEDGTYLPIRVIVVTVPARHKAIDALWHGHLSNAHASEREALVSLASKEDSQWLTIASKIKIIHEDRVGHIDNCRNGGMTLRLELSL